MPTCQSLETCNFAPISRILDLCGYIPDGTPCNCIETKPVYNPEWDEERLQYLSKVNAGFFFSPNLIAGILENTDNESGVFAQVLEEYTSDQRRMASEMIRRVREKLNFPNPHDKRIWISIEEKKGFVDLRWGGSQICEIYLSPPHWMSGDNGYYLSCLKQYSSSYSMCDRSEIDNTKISCVPMSFPMERHGEESEIGLGVCADFALRTAFLILDHKKAPTVPQIRAVAEREVLKDLISASDAEGMSSIEISSILEAFGYNVHNCFSYPVQCPKCDEEFYPFPESTPSLESAYAYIESGIPTILTFSDSSVLPWRKNEDGEPHAIVAIGHTLNEENEVDGLIVHDETSLPYQVLPSEIKGTRLDDLISDIIAPTPLMAGVPYGEAKIFLEEIPNAISNISEGNIKIRPILVESVTAKMLFTGQIPRAHLIDYRIVADKGEMDDAHLSRYVWFFELKYNDNKYYGDILVNGERTDPPILAFNLPEENKYLYRDEAWGMMGDFE